MILTSLMGRFKDGCYLFHCQGDVEVDRTTQYCGHEKRLVIMSEVSLPIRVSTRLGLYGPCYWSLRTKESFMFLFILTLWRRRSRCHEDGTPLTLYRVFRTWWYLCFHIFLQPHYVRGTTNRCRRCVLGALTLPVSLIDEFFNESEGSSTSTTRQNESSLEKFFDSLRL